MSGKIIVISGPTGAGKTAFSLFLAQKINGEIISADSRQVYTDLNIGTAKITPEEKKDIPHHLINICGIQEQYTAGHFLRNADSCIQAIWAQKKIPIVVGGTAFYIKSLLYGLSNVPSVHRRIRAQVREELQEKGAPAMHALLCDFDPIAAAKINPNDHVRIARAVEVFRSTGNPLSWFWKHDVPQLRYDAYTIQITKKREVLYQDINHRVDEMIRQGLYEEFLLLLSRGYTENDVGMKTMGYVEFFSYLQHKLTWKETIETIKQHMRRYAKRQLTWLRKAKIDLTITAERNTLLTIHPMVRSFLQE